MKKIAIILGLTLSTQALAADISATCTTKGKDDSLWSDVSKFALKISNNDITLTDASDAKNVIKGVFSKMAKNGAYVFASQDVADLADQTNGGSILVDANLEKGRNGRVSFSTFQMGDSEGGSWLTENFSCVVQKTK